ncbi:MAG: SusC/RagA family TonB-linked outer membrane protein [Phocaeicola sp.]
MKTWIKRLGKVTPLLFTMALSTAAKAEMIENHVYESTQQTQRTVKGIVKDKSGETIIGANVIVKGSARGVITDFEGNFQLEVPTDALLEISYVGYLTQTIKLTSQGFYTILLEEDSKSLDEVVVVGYGVQKKVNLSGAVESLKGEKISQRATIQTSQALQGMVPGVTITTNSGKPGAEGMSVRIRGIGTLNSNDPLVLIDGVTSSLDAIDPNDIENISVLKDAASSSIYGSRAANGVILITTKQGMSEKVNLTYKTSLGITSPVTRIKPVSAWDYMTLYDEASSNDLRTDDGRPGGVLYGPELIETWKNATDRDAYPNSDLWNETFKKSSVQTQHYLGISGGTENFQSNTSINYSWQDALIENTNFARYGLRSNNTYKYNKYLEFSANISLRQSDHEDSANIPGYSQVSSLMRHPAIYATKYSNGVWGPNYAGHELDAMRMEEKSAMSYNTYTELLSKLQMTIKPLESLRIDFSYAPKINYREQKNVTKNTYLYDRITGEQIYKSVRNSYITEERWKTREDDINILTNFNETFGKHFLGIMGGFQYIKSSYNSLYAYRDGNEFPQYEEMDSYDRANQRNSGTTTEWALMSYFGRLNYAFSDKYLLEANIRYDGSSRFAKGHKWGLFPSFSAAWRFSSEEFMDNVDWVSNGKIRASWGELGNQDGLGSNYPFALNVSTSQFGAFGNTLTPGYAPVNYALNSITWETTRMINFGIDLGFFNNALNITFDWYKKDTRDMLLTMAIPGVMGYANSPKQNAGSVENKGWDLSVSYSNRAGNVDYRITGVLSDVINKITDLGGLLPQVSGQHVNMVGAPINALYGYLADGYFSSFTEARNSSVTQWGKLQGGDIKYIDVNDNQKMDGDDRAVIGNVIPRWTYSLDFYAGYNGFELSAFFQGVGKRDTYMGGWEAYPFGEVPLAQHFDRWNEANPNPSARYPRLAINQRANNTQPSTHWLLNASYLRLKNLQFAYNFNSRLFKNNLIKGLRLFANGNNLFTVSNLPLGMDPESPEELQNGYPLVKTYTFGVEVKF